MDTKVQLQEHGEAPPPYFQPIVAQPTVSGNPENYPMAFIQPGGMPANYTAGQAGQSTAYQNQAFYPGQFVQPQYPQMVQGYPNPVDTILANENKLSFHSNQAIACGTGTLIVQIRGAQNQLIMSTLLTNNVVANGHSHSHDHNHTVSQSTISFNDPAGKNIMTCKQAMNDLTLSAGDRFLGIIQGAPMGCSCCAGTLSAHNSNGEVYFETTDTNQGSEFTFVRNGTTIATARKGVINGDDFGVEFSGSLEPNSKAMIVAVSYYLYVLHHAQTSCGCTGTLTLMRCVFVIPLCVFLAFTITMVIVATTVLS